MPVKKAVKAAPVKKKVVRKAATVTAVPVKQVKPRAVRKALADHYDNGPAQVPDKSILNWYIPRTIGGRREFEVFDAARSMKMNVLIEGPTGPGKTTACEAYAAARDQKFYAIPSSVGAEPSQLFGKMMPDGEGGWEWIDGPVTDIVRNGGVLLINEVNFLPERVGVVLFSLLDGRRLIMLMDHKNEVIKAHRPGGCWCDFDPVDCEKRWVIVLADMNPEYAGTRPLNAAFRNRFAIQLDWDYDLKVEEQLIPSETLRRLIGRFRADANIFTPVATNMGQEFVKACRALGIDFAIENFAMHFDTDERAIVKRSLEAVASTLKDEIAVPEPEPEPDDDEPDDDDEFVFGRDDDYVNDDDDDDLDDDGDDD